MEEEVTFESLLKLRNQVGLKSFKDFEAECVFNKKNTKSSKKTKVKSQESDEEAPMEISSKTPFKKKKKAVVKEKIHHTRDPRFDNRIGKFNEEKFKKNYQFAYDMRNEEIEQMKKDIKKDEKKKYIVQRIENQKRESANRMQKRNANKTVEVLPDGSKFYKTKKLQRTEELVNKFVELKKAGKLEKHLDKRRKKQAGKERKKMNIDK